MKYSSLKDVFEADKKGQLEEWTINYLLGEGKNSELAGFLKAKENKTFELKEFPLKQLKRIIGPEPGIKYFEREEKWERRVNDILEAMKLGIEFPPLIVTDFWEEFSISDGGHRHEAFLRLGKDSYWIIFISSKK